MLGKLTRNQILGLIEKMKSNSLHFIVAKALKRTYNIDSTVTAEAI